MLLLLSIACSDPATLQTLPDPGDELGDDSGESQDSGEHTGDSGDLPPSCDVYAAPDGELSNPGTLDAPWPSLQALAEAQALPTAGTLCLLPGHHGAPVLRELSATELHIVATELQSAWVTSLQLIDVSAVRFQGLLVHGTDIDTSRDERDLWLVSADADSHDLVFQDLLVESAPDSSTWTVSDWTTRAKSGVDLRGERIQVLDTQIRNTHHALSLRGDHALVQGCLVDNFGGDGIRGLGSHSTYAWNTVRDAYVDAYETQHDDAFQAYGLEGDLKIEGVRIEHNQFLLFADPLTEFVLEQGLVGTLMQGVVITDGYADGWVVENNLVVNANYHGISLYGGRNCRIQNNTVVRHPDMAADSGPWIRISPQTKTGQDNFDNVIRNNLAAMLTPWDYDASSIVEANLELDDLSVFVDAAGLDFDLAPGGQAVDAGQATDLAERDLAGRPRLSGAAPDLGAYELQVD